NQNGFLWTRGFITRKIDNDKFKTKGDVLKEKLYTYTTDMKKAETSWPKNTPPPPPSVKRAEKLLRYEISRIFSSNLSTVTNTSNDDKNLHDFRKIDKFQTEYHWRAQLRMKSTL
uniref:Uncharacterized protein n=1 Tax=Romanomermis culicivorax TaxID=13658 RepID=A0A915K6Q4_ROMCU